MDTRDFTERETMGGLTREQLIELRFDDLARVAKAEGVTMSALFEWLEAGWSDEKLRQRWGQLPS